MRSRSRRDGDGEPDGSGVCRKSRLRRYSTSPAFGTGRAERGVAVLRRFFTGDVSLGVERLRLELPADLTALMLGAVHIDVEIAGLERRILRVGQLRSGRDGPPIVPVLVSGMTTGPFLPAAPL